MARVFALRPKGKKAAVCLAHAVMVSDNPSPRRSP
jgi:hypothetical protein